MRIKNEIDKRQQLESGGHPVDAVNCLKFITQSSILQPKREESKRLSYRDTKNKQISFSYLQMSSNHTLEQTSFCLGKTFFNHSLGQNILSYNVEGARISLNSLIFSQGGTDSLLWTPTNVRLFPHYIHFKTIGASMC